MKKFIVFLIVVILLTVPSGTVLGQDTCPTDNGWSCFNLEGFNTEGLYFIIEYDYPIQKIWIDGFLFENDTERENCFFITGLGTKRVEVLSNCSSIREIGEYFISPATVTPTNTATPAITVTPTNTATPTITVTPTNTATPTVTEISSSKPTVLLIVGLSLLALAAVIIIIAVKALTKKKH